jgi:hypothetical protein
VIYAELDENDTPINAGNRYSISSLTSAAELVVMIVGLLLASAARLKDIYTLVGGCGFALPKNVLTRGRYK